MGLSYKIKSFFDVRSETQDRHPDLQLVSRYYKTSNQNALKAVEELLKGQKGYEITSVSAERGEISANLTAGKRAILTATVITVRPLETAVDFIVMTETPLPTDFGYSKKIIVQLYEQLDKKLMKIT